MKLQRRTTVITEAKEEPKVITDKGELELASDKVTPVADQEFVGAQKQIEANKEAAEKAIKDSGIEEVSKEVAEEPQKHKTPAPKMISLKPYTEAKKAKNRSELATMISECKAAGRQYKISRCLDEGFRYLFEELVEDCPDCKFVCHTEEGPIEGYFDTEDEAIEYAQSNDAVCCIFKESSEGDEKVWERPVNEGCCKEDGEELECPVCHKKPCECKNDKEVLKEATSEEADKAWDNWEKFKEAIGADKAGDELAKSIGDDSLADNLKFLFSQWDINTEDTLDESKEQTNELLNSNKQLVGDVNINLDAHEFGGTGNNVDVMHTGLDATKTDEGILPDLGNIAGGIPTPKLPGLGEEKADEAADLDKLAKEEKDAVDSYQAEIDNSTSSEEKEVLKHIQGEEEEHGEELQDLKDGKPVKLTEAVVEDVPADDEEPVVDDDNEIVADDTVVDDEPVVDEAPVDDVVADVETEVADAETPEFTNVNNDELVDIDNIETFQPQGETATNTFMSIKTAGDGAMYAFKDTLKDIYNLKCRVGDLQKLLADSSDWLLNLLGLTKDEETSFIEPSEEIPASALEPEAHPELDEFDIEEAPVEKVDPVIAAAPVVEAPKELARPADPMATNGWEDPVPLDLDEEDVNGPKLSEEEFKAKYLG